MIRIILLLPGLAFLIPACLPGATASPVPFLAPTSPVLEASSSPIPAYTVPPQPSPAALGSNTPTTGLPGQPGLTSACISSLRFIQDVNFPDDTVVQPGQQIPKTWLVENNGTCDWDSHYRLRFSGGIPMGAETEQALYPARSGTQAELKIIFTAPETPGTYRSEWQVIDPGGSAIGDLLYIQINVQAP